MDYAGAIRSQITAKPIAIVARVKVAINARVPMASYVHGSAVGSVLVSAEPNSRLTIKDHR